MLQPTLNHHRICFGDRCSLTFHRTLRIPDDGHTYPLPPGLGTFPVHRVGEYRHRLDQRINPQQRHLWQDEDFLISLFQREALWIGFQGQTWKPNAVQIGIGRINAVSAQSWEQGDLSDQPQNYLVIPQQLWLDGINTEEESVRQFVAMPLGQGYSVEAALTGQEQFGGIQVKVYDPKPGIFPDQPPPPPSTDCSIPPGLAMARPAASASMGLGAGGQMRQKIYRDPYGLPTWDPTQTATATVHILNSDQYAAVTGQAPTPSPIDVATYIRYGLPWFDLYDEAIPAIAGAKDFAHIKTLQARDAELGQSSAGQNSSVEGPES
ncbi:hypothetical protein [Lyngbya confervoides]|uniref:Integral membrane protein n=1 Tax=Lyngbya confervoides BDU141951 TaxID=1574623 RepID=A0ABD4T1U1_9CYAN|nr:hypothetical protein [Lyngbya confervoides]MCM1982629.1 hypothetical protein [Lyngbya confervoides BDU141951]